jgi:tetratricopeptide (TPR) repeat protein
LARGDRAEARKSFEKAVAASPGWPAAELSLAELDIAEGKLDTARTALSALLSANSRSIVAWLMLASVEEQDGNSSAAIGYYRKALEIDPRNVHALNNLAYRLAENNQADEALKYAQQAKELAPDNPAVDNTLGWAYYRKGIYMSAVRHLESAASKQGTALRNYHLAMAYMKAGDQKKGEQVLQLALKMNPKLPEAEAARQLLRASTQQP